MLAFSMQFVANVMASDPTGVSAEEVQAKYQRLFRCVQSWELKGLPDEARINEVVREIDQEIAGESAASKRFQELKRKIENIRLTRAQEEIRNKERRKDAFRESKRELSRLERELRMLELSMNDYVRLSLSPSDRQNQKKAELEASISAIKAQEKAYELSSVPEERAEYQEFNSRYEEEVVKPRELYKAKLEELSKSRDALIGYVLDLDEMAREMGCLDEALLMAEKEVATAAGSSEASWVDPIAVCEAVRNDKLALQQKIDEMEGLKRAIEDEWPEDEERFDANSIQRRPLNGNAQSSIAKLRYLNAQSKVARDRSQANMLEYERKVLEDSQKSLLRESEEALMRAGGEAERAQADSEKIKNSSKKAEKAHWQAPQSSSVSILRRLALYAFGATLIYLGVHYWQEQNAAKKRSNTGAQPKKANEPNTAVEKK